MMNLFISALTIAVWSAAALQAAEYHVSPTQGNDRNSGMAKAPFKTIERAATSMKPGDICWLHNGRYQCTTTLDGLRGTAESPIVFKPWPGDRAVLDGTMQLPSEWTPWKRKIYRMRVNEPIWQLFSGNDLVHVARWPNASFEDGSIWRMEESMRFTERSKTKPGVIYDCNPAAQKTDDDSEGVVKLKTRKQSNQTTLAQTNMDVTGSIAVLNIGHWLTWARPITDHKAGRNWFEYDPSGTRMAKYAAYYILGLPALDRPNEWWYDAEKGMIYLRPVGDRDPNKLSISAKTRDFTLRLNNCSYVIFQGVDFFAGTFSMRGCEHVVIENCTLDYPSTHKFMLGEFGWCDEDHSELYPNDRSKRRFGPNVCTHVVNKGDGPFHNAVRNCEIAYPNSPAIHLRSPGSSLENCYIHDIEWDVNSSGGSGSVSGGKHSIIRNNTIHSSGNSEGIRPGSGSVIEYNRLWNMGNLQHDGSAINIGTGAQVGTVVRYNWVHDTNRQGIRFDSTASGMGYEGCVHNNVVFSLGHGGSKFKGDKHLLFNNTFHDSYFAIPNSFGATPPHNRNTSVCNTLADLMIAWTPRRPDEPIHAMQTNNVTGSGVVESNLRDPANLDFRPKPDSRIIDAGILITKPSSGSRVRFERPPTIGAAPDIGAYEFGDPTYWIPGRKEKIASTPIPPHQAENVKIEADLIFLPAYKAKKHIVIFMNEAMNHKGKTELTDSNIADPGKLQSDHTYTWRVDAVMPDGSVVEGKPWTFRVE